MYHNYIPLLYIFNNRPNWDYYTYNNECWASFSFIYSPRITANRATWAQIDHWYDKLKVIRDDCSMMKFIITSPRGLYVNDCNAINMMRFMWHYIHSRADMMVANGPLTRYVKLRIAHAPGMPGTFPPNRLQRKPLVSDPDMHHDTGVKRVPWCMLLLLL